MKEIFAEVPQAISNTVAIAERCAVDIEFGVYHVPVFEPEDGSIWCGASTAASLDAVLGELMKATGEGGPMGIDACLSAADLKLGDRHRINSHAGEPLGDLMIAETPLSTRPQDDPEALDSLKLLTGYAIDSTRRTRALVSANERFAALAKNIPGVVYQRVVRPNGDIGYTYISDAAKDLFGVSRNHQEIRQVVHQS